MPLTAQQEADVLALTQGLSAEEITAMKLSGQKQRIETLREEWKKKKINLDVAIGNYLAALDVADSALNRGITTEITTAKQSIVDTKVALVAALQAAK